MNVPQVYADVDRTKAQMLDVPVNNVFDALQIYLGSVYVNDFNFLGRTYRVTAQAEPEFRDDADDISKIRTRSDSRCHRVARARWSTSERTAGPDRLVRSTCFPRLT